MTTNAVMLRSASRQNSRLRRLYRYWKSDMGLSLKTYLKSWTILGGCGNIALASTVFLGLWHWVY